MSNEENKIIDPMGDIPGIRSKFISSVQNSTSKPIQPMQFDVRVKSFEEKVYIILYTINNIDEDDPTSKTFSVCIGRTMAYMDIKNKLQSGLDIDVHRSYIMTETKQTETETGNGKYYMIPYDECMSVYAFCISVANFYNDEDFDIEDYANGDVPEDNRMDRTMHVMSREQMEYRELLEESLSRDKFLTDMRRIYGPDSAKEI